LLDADGQTRRRGEEAFSRSRKEKQAWRNSWVERDTRAFFLLDVDEDVQVLSSGQAQRNRSDGKETDKLKLM
jgi:hypothetical protein